MWVLDARANAEKITYPVVWEEEKIASNVINYNINKEVTIDTSSVFNANNDTTTGMATVIPWINAPKLIQTTSIYSNVEAPSWWVTITWVADLDYPNNTETSIRNWTLSDQYGNIPFKNKTDWSSNLRNGFLIPVEWRYNLYIAYPQASSSHYFVTKLFLVKWWYWNDVLIVNHTWPSSNTQEYETIKYNFAAWDVIMWYVELHYHWSASYFWTNRSVVIQITKL